MGMQKKRKWKWLSSFISSGGYPCSRQLVHRTEARMFAFTTETCVKTLTPQLHFVVYL